MIKKDSHQDLNQKLEKIKKVFEIQSILNLKPDKDYIRSYYKANKFAYSIFHTFSDNIHMGISRNGKYKDSDLYEAERFIEKYIKQLNAKNVFELGTGKGTASSYLAARYEDVNFEGIDITEEQLKSAYKRVKKLKNFHPVKGDYHNLGSYKDGAFDVVFVIEALCHSPTKEKVLGGGSSHFKTGWCFYYF